MTQVSSMLATRSSRPSLSMSPRLVRALCGSLNPTDSSISSQCLRFSPGLASRTSSGKSVVRKCCALALIWLAIARGASQSSGSSLAERTAAPLHASPFLSASSGSISSRGFPYQSSWCSMNPAAPSQRRSKGPSSSSISPMGVAQSLGSSSSSSCSLLSSSARSRLASSVACTSLATRSAAANFSRAPSARRASSFSRHWASVVSKSDTCTSSLRSCPRFSASSVSCPTARASRMRTGHCSASLTTAS
mmetsp:Transcript_17177/g.65135  ORF Transcript_17177/g.65135 Transcript_17177/m.65135 type:complete len:249 (+) Transcript_17177:1549-2295(+)